MIEDSGRFKIGFEMVLVTVGQWVCPTLVSEIRMRIEVDIPVENISDHDEWPSIST